MFKKCDGCGSRIISGGESYSRWTFCDESCLADFKAGLVDQLVPEELVREKIREVFESPCPLCGKPARNDIYSATKISAFLVFFTAKTDRRLCCSGCGRKYRLLAAIHCLFAGWWGPKAAICNVFVLPTNLIAMLFIRNPKQPSRSLVSFVKSALADSPEMMAAIQKSTPPDELA